MAVPFDWTTQAIVPFGVAAVGGVIGAVAVLYTSHRQIKVDAGKVQQQFDHDRAQRATDRKADAYAPTSRFLADTGAFFAWVERAISGNHQGGERVPPPSTDQFNNMLSLIRLFGSDDVCTKMEGLWARWRALFQRMGNPNIDGLLPIEDITERNAVIAEIEQVQLAVGELLGVMNDELA